MSTVDREEARDREQDLYAQLAERDDENKQLREELRLAKRGAVLDFSERNKLDGVAELRSQLRAAEQRIEALTEAIHKYGDHLEGCEKVTWWIDEEGGHHAPAGDQPCTCDFDVARAALSVEAEAPQGGLTGA